MGRTPRSADPGPRPLRHLPAVLDAADADGDWLLFASEIKALLASGLVDARPDLRGINHVFTFFALPGPVTCFEGVQLPAAGPLPRRSSSARRRAHRSATRVYWEIDFPDRGRGGRRGDDPKPLDRRVRGA